MSTIPYLQGVLKGLLKSRKVVEDKINIKPHFVPVTLNAIKVSLHYLDDKQLQEFVNKVEHYVSKYRALTVYSASIFRIDNVIVEPREIIEATPLRVLNSSGELIGLLFKNFDAAGRNFFTSFLNKELVEYVNKKAYENSKRKEGFDIGHTYIQDEYKYGQLANTPLSMQVGTLVNLVNTLNTKGTASFFEAAKEVGIPRSQSFRPGANMKTQISNVANSLNSYFSSFISKHSYGQKVTMTLNKDIRGMLMQVSANIVLIQDREENQGDFAKVESNLRKEVEKILPTIHFSKNMVEEIEARLIETIKFGKIKSPNVKVSKKITEDNRTNKVKTNSSVSIKTLNTKLPKLRNLQGQFTSVTSIESLIRTGLHQTILKNMQRPNLRNRTGRFAESVQLESLSRARDGSLQAFLSYMKYPYATFEKGGRQGNKGYYPSRLIDQSVRELASKLVKERMKVTIK